MYTNPVSTLLVYLHIAVSCVGMLSRVRYILSGRVLTPKVKILTNARGTSLLQPGFSCGSIYLHFYIYASKCTRVYPHASNCTSALCIVGALGGACSRVPLIDLHTAGMADYPGLPHHHHPNSPLLVSPRGFT